MGVKEGIIVGVASIAPLFSQVVNQAFTEQATLVPKASSPACTVRFNRYDDGAPIDERYINTQHADDTKYGGITHSGITYTQNGTLNGVAAQNTDVSFQAEAGLDDWYMPDGHYYESDSGTPGLDTYVGSPIGRVDGVLYDSRYTNWTQSAEVEIESPQTCLNVRKALEERPLPAFNALNIWGGKNSNGYAERIWENTGFPTDFDDLKNTTGVKMISREERLTQDRASGQLQSDYSALPPPWKP